MFLCHYRGDCRNRGGTPAWRSINVKAILLPFNYLAFESSWHSSCKRSEVADQFAPEHDIAALMLDAVPHWSLEQ